MFNTIKSYKVYERRLKVRNTLELITGLLVSIWWIVLGLVVVELVYNLLRLV